MRTEAAHVVRVVAGKDDRDPARATNIAAVTPWTNRSAAVPWCLRAYSPRLRACWTMRRSGTDAVDELS